MTTPREKGSFRPVKVVKVEKGLKPNNGVTPNRTTSGPKPPPPSGGGSTSKAN